MKYPVGIQDFRVIREGDYVYVDKTEQIFNVVDGGKYFFLSRPRRFGKSLTLSTMNELYSGSRELFSGLWIEDKWDWEANVRPIIWLKFASMDHATLGLERALWRIIKIYGDEMGVPLAGESLPLDFDTLIKGMAKRHGRVVLLVDEYDKPIIDHLGDTEPAEANRQLLKRFYAVLKDNDPNLELVFITGVAAFSKVSLFSDLNNIANISLSHEGRTLVGITQAELDDVFGERLKLVDREKVRQWYNGYSWGGPEKVYNPFSILRFLKHFEYQNYWFETGSPSFLVEEMRKQRYYDIGRITVGLEQLITFRLDQLDPIAVLFQTGYLTIVESEPGAYVLDYPNREVRESLHRFLLNVYLDYPLFHPAPKVLDLRNALRQKDLDAVFRIINSLFADLPYDFWHRDDEHFFHALIHLTFSLLGVYIRSEVHSAHGRCDALVETDDYVYAFEFKRDRPAAEALAQIRERGYLAGFAGDEREVMGVGVSFDSEAKQVANWEVE